LPGIPLLTARRPLLAAVGWWLQESGAALQRLGRLF